MLSRSSLTFIFLFLLLCGFTSELSAQSDNPAISIQGMLKDANGNSVTDGTQELIFRFYAQNSGGSALWTETAPVSVVGGIYSHNLGSVEPLNESDFDRRLFLGVTVNGQELFPRTELTYAPYALSVATAQRIARGACSGQVGDIKHSILAPSDFAMENGECWVPMDGRDITGTKLADYGMTNVPDMSGLFIRTTGTDVFQTSNDYFYSGSYGGIATEGGRYFDSRRFGLGATWKFGNQQAKAAKRAKGALDDELGRIGG